jgi:peptidoglycan hydrolase-like protein with peptidoglycan-binding domain
MSTLAGVSTSLGKVGDPGLGAKMPGIAAEVWTQCKLLGAEASALLGYPGSGGAEHGSGYAIDFMVGYPGGHDRGEVIRKYVWEHRERHGLKWLIWEQTFYSLNTPNGRPMEDRGSPNQNHMNHLHIFWDNSPYTYLQKPPLYPVRTLYRGASGVDVKALQRGLNAVFDFEGDFLVVDGKFGAATEADVKAYQVLKKLGVDGRVGPATRKSLATTSGISL